MHSLQRKIDICTRAVSLLLTAVLLTVLASACRKSQSPAAIAVNVQTAQPTRGPIDRRITLPATIAPYEEATLYAKVAGYLKSIPVDKGDVVKQGDLLADIEVPELLADRAKYAAEVQVAEIDYKRVQYAQKKAPDLVVPQTVDDAKAKLDVARADQERNETLLSYTKITAPFSGVITKRLVDPGAFIPAATMGSAAQNAALLTLTDYNVVRVQVAIPEPEVPFITDGLLANVTVSELPGRTFDCSITRYSHALDDATKTMLAEIEVANVKHELRPGMYATVVISVEHKNDALLVPADALVVEKVKNSVFAVVDNKAKKVPVKVGFSDPNFVEIIDGLPAGSPVITVGKQNLNDGQPVNVSAVASK
jgi:membrane fusion protein (multidrug efflux system)